jgi:hypothetical protein
MATGVFFLVLQKPRSARVVGLGHRLIPWLSLSAGGSGLVVGAVPQATCRSCDSAAVVHPPPCPGLPGRA